MHVAWVPTIFRDIHETRLGDKLGFTCVITCASVRDCFAAEVLAGNRSEVEEERGVFRTHIMFGDKRYASMFCDTATFGPALNH